MEVSGLSQMSPRPAVWTTFERADAAPLILSLSDGSIPDSALTPEQARQLTTLLEVFGPERTGLESIQKALVSLSQLQQTLQDRRTRLIEHTAMLAPLLEGLVDDLPSNLRWLLAEPVTRARTPETRPRPQPSERCPRCATPLYRTPNGDVVCRVCSAA
jgi:hypothetical protein